ncbi:hypothetical protein [uncultured Pseudacidovorax sp.]|uniref:hypothetical protein n=1 Tax=uncultured Pseudacidovorax sp. TaxID=679313 RepID=UPI0025D499DF|nr:hypothetical protein [uncultured Pseudacidovorax sp.]
MNARPATGTGPVPTTRPATARPAVRDRLAQAGLATAALCTVLRLMLGGGAGWLTAAALGLAVFAAAAWPRVSPQARFFGALAVPAAALVWLVASAPGPILEGAVAQSTQFAALLAALATLRLPMRRSPLMGRAAASLLAARPGLRHGAVLFGSHWLSLMFSFGVVPMMGELLERAGLHVRSSPVARGMLAAVIRGLAMTTAWSPMAISFAIVSSALPTLGVLPFVATGMLAAALILGVELIADHRSRPPTESADPATSVPSDGRALALILGMSVLLFLATLLLHDATGWSFMACATLTIPALSLAWALGQSTPPSATPGRGRGARSALSHFFEVLTETRSEIFVFSSALFIGQAVLAAARALGLGDGAGLPGWLLPLLCLVSIPLVAALSVAPTIAVLIWAQVFAGAASALAAPLTHALALTLGWSLAITVSPVSATLLLAGAMTGVPPREIALGWNLGFVLRSAVVAGLLLAGLYRLGC